MKPGAQLHINIDLFAAVAALGDLLPPPRSIWSPISASTMTSLKEISCIQLAEKEKKKKKKKYCSQE